MQQWQSVLSPTPGMTRITSAVVIIQMVRLLDLCITNGDLDASTAIFRVVVTREEESPDAQFENVYCPLVPQLRELFRKHSAFDFYTHPFKDFMRFLIEQTLHKVGLKPAATPTMRAIGCGCHVCGTLDLFMLSNNTAREFPGPRKQGQHLEQQISQASDIVTSSRSRPNGNKGKAFTLVVTKRTENPAFTQWKVRLKVAQSFLTSIGDSDMISKIMGPRIVDVLKVLNGVAGFAVDPSLAGMFRSQQSATTAPPTTTTAAKNTTTRVCPTYSNGAPMLGTHNVSGSASKRKREGAS